MARSTKANGKLVRRLGVNIYANRKYDRLLKRKPQGPGLERGFRSRKKLSDYGRQLIEKQKLRYSYGISEKQFYNTFLKAKKQKSGLTGDNFLILLESRLDNVVYRLGWASTRAQARQLVSHGHIKLNGGRSGIPSMLVRVGDVLRVKERDSSKKIIRESMAHNSGLRPEWLNLREDELAGEVTRYPTRQDIETMANEQLVVEFYSR